MKTIVNELRENQVLYGKVCHKFRKGQIIKGLIWHAKEVIFYLFFKIVEVIGSVLAGGVMLTEFKIFYSYSCMENICHVSIKVKTVFIVILDAKTGRLKKKKKEKQNQCNWCHHRL